MSICSFIETAKILYRDKKYEEALCLVCNAVDACAVKKYPDVKENNERYKLFLKENFSVLCHYGFPGVEASSILIKIDNPISELKTDKDGCVNME